MPCRPLYSGLLIHTRGDTSTCDGWPRRVHSSPSQARSIPHVEDGFRWDEQYRFPLSLQNFRNSFLQKVQKHKGDGDLNSSKVHSVHEASLSNWGLNKAIVWFFENMILFSKTIHGSEGSGMEILQGVCEVEALRFEWACGH